MKKENRKDKFANYVEYRLTEWANWYRDGNKYGLGYPARTLEHKLMTEGI